MGAEEVRAVLEAYKTVMEASWPSLHPHMAERARSWPKETEDNLRAELERYVRDSAAHADSRVRIFWKIGEKYQFAGCNALFAQDAGLHGPADLIGIDDFDEKLPWVRQAPKYRADDEEVYRTGEAKLDIVERQGQAEGNVHWLRVGKAPIRTSSGVIGLLGMYEVLSNDAGRKLYQERMQRPSATP
jgi:hypothetical protein